MKYFTIFIFTLLVSCGTVKKTYMCGERPCIDKKEFNKYFSENLIVEIQTKKLKKKTSVDLVKLNLSTADKKKKKKNFLKLTDINNKKKQKSSIKLEKTRLKEERKMIKIEEKIKNKEANKLVKLRKKNEKNQVLLNQKNNIENEKQLKKLEKIKKTKNTRLEDTNIKKNKEIDIVKSKAQVSVCDAMPDCDIDKIAELLIKKGNEKAYPDITSK